MFGCGPSWARKATAHFINDANFTKKCWVKVNWVIKIVRNKIC